jgi:fatty-acyl-CoA synthase
MDVDYLIRRAAREHPGAPAVDDGVCALTTRELVARAERIANALDAMGVPPGAPVGILLENRWEYVLVDAAIALGRRVRVAFNARLHLDDFAYMASDAGIALLFHSGRYAEEAAALQEQLGILAVDVDAGLDALERRGAAGPVVRGGDAEDAAWITYTSGTTGRPKGVVLSHRSISTVAFNLLLELGPVRPGRQVVLTQALSHGAGYFVLPWLISGAGVYVVRKFDPAEVLEVARRPHADMLKIVPAMIPPLLEENGGDGLDFDSIVYGAAPIAPALLERAIDRLGPVLVQIYGQSEAPVTLTCLGKEDHLGDGDQRFSAGREWRTVATEIRDAGGAVLGPGEVGELHVRAPQVMTGYHGLAEATAAVLVDGWISTSDMARRDERGFITLLGRRDEMINSGGYNISPREVERVLSEHPAVSEAVVFGRPDERWGQAVTAAVRAATGVTITPAELSEFARPRLGFRAPKTISVLDAIPLTPYGKVDRTRLLAAVDALAEGN